jgi:hypothetical protein
VAQRLRELGHPLYAAFMDYLRDRRDLSSLDSYRIFLIWDKDNWSESNLDDLAELDITLDPLIVHVARIKGLVALVDNVYAAVPCACEPIDDD